MTFEQLELFIMSGGFTITFDANRTMFVDGQSYSQWREYADYLQGLRKEVEGDYEHYRIMSAHWLRLLVNLQLDGAEEKRIKEVRREFKHLYRQKVLSEMALKDVINGLHQAHDACELYY
jgi:hypothetical protein